MFEQRAHGSEFLDRPDADPRLTQQSYRFMKLVNRIGGGIGVVRNFLARELSESSDVRTVRILDLGSGGGDIPVAITRWANERGHRVQFTCIDCQAEALAVAEKAIARAHIDTIQLERADAFSYRPAGEFDYAIGSMTFHHLTADQIDRLITHLRGFVRKAVLINDLHRCALNYAMCHVLAVPFDAEVRHDALLSIRRGFKPAELSQMLRKHDPARVVRRSWFCRVAGVVRLDRKEGE